MITKNSLTTRQNSNLTKFVLSRKVKSSVERCINEVITGSFTETTIKELMIDLRELARSAPKIGLDDPKYRSVFLEFVDICDFIAHTNRKKGLFESKIRERSERMADALTSGDQSHWEKVTKVPPVGDMGSIVEGLLGTSFLFLRQFEKTLSPSLFLLARRKKIELAFCIISLLQDSIIELKDDCGVAILHILVHEGYFRLYCRVHGSRIETEAMRRTDGSGRIAIGFPVLVTRARDVDQILPQCTPGLGPMEDHFSLPPLIETYRNADGRLRVRIVAA